MLLYDPEEHMSLISRPWSADAAKECAVQIFQYLCDGYDPAGGWPTHPDEDGQLRFNKCLYNGATGTLWALDELSRRLKLELPLNAAAMSEQIYRDYLSEPDSEGVVAPSYFIGESSILLLKQKFAPSEETLQKLRQSIRDNTQNPVNEALWGCPGTMIAALRINEAELFQKSADYLFQQWHLSEDLWIWTQDLYGKIRNLTGAGHGFFGNAYSLLEGQHLLTEAQRKILHERIAHTAIRSANHRDGLVNWYPSFQRTEDKPCIVQWCHGAPGVITSLRSFPKHYSKELEELLLGAGETIWKSGPLQTIALCHGTDGNGFALLRLFERTGDEMWLERARQFAMHAIAQRNGRYTLWTGEAGLALFLLACIDGKADFPSLDYF